MHYDEGKVESLTWTLPDQKIDLTTTLWKGRDIMTT